MRKNFLFLIIVSIGLFVALFLVDKRVNLFSRAAGKSANLIVDTSLSLSAKDHWKSLAQGGEETGRMLSKVIPEIKALSPEYIRIDHVFDFYGVVKRGGSGLEFNFTRLDEMIDDILSSGAKPFISLSYMPPSITSGTEVDYPLNWSDWELLVQKTIEHTSGERGIEGVYYEVWNEPDLFGNFKTYGQKNYLELYLHSSVGAQRAKGVRPFLFGGPATTALYENWFIKFFEFVEKNNLRVDFYSWHHYSERLSDFEDDLSNINSWKERIDERFSDIEFIISEMGHNSKNDPGYDSRFGAVHTLSLATVLDGEVDRAFSFEIKDGAGPTKFWGRWGLLTHEKWGEIQKKDRYNALLFLNRMRGGRAAVAGQGSWVKAFARNENGTVRVLVVNFDENGKHTEAVPITFANLSSQNFILKKSDFLGAVRERNIATDSASLSVTEFFPANSASLLELIPQN